LKTSTEIILAVDTSGRQGSVAVACATPGFRVVEVVPLEGGSYSSQLVPQLSALLARHNLDKHSIAGLAAASGPGSFTGLRVGLSAIKALGEVLGKPIAAVSVLQAVASRARAPGRILALLDAGRKQVFVGDYEWPAASAGAGAEIPVSRRELLLTQEELIAAVRQAGSAQVITPDPPVAAMLAEAGVAVEGVAWPDAGVIARLGWEKILRGETVAPEALDANYIRRSDAEIFAK